MRKKMTTHQIYRLVAIGFCQPKFYKKSVWTAAKKLMDGVLCPNDLAYPFDFGRGKGKYSSKLSINDAQAQTVELLRKNGTVLTQHGFVLVENDSRSPKPINLNTEQINWVAQRSIQYVSYDQTLHTASIFEQKQDLLNSDMKWLTVDEFICLPFVIDISKGD